jgi:hypothetical protein
MYSYSMECKGAGVYNQRMGSGFHAVATTRSLLGSSEGGVTTQTVRSAVPLLRSDRVAAAASPAGTPTAIIDPAVEYAGPAWGLSQFSRVPRATMLRTVPESRKWDCPL